MKKKLRLNKWFTSVTVLASVMVLPSCLDDDTNDYYRYQSNALVTVKPTTDNSFFMQLDDRTTLYPVN
ncbi:MAG: NigD-like N-terminal domain-containing protein, partial [Phocaeicola sp.]|nr:NigD-like N-terminal domain-containing protein [Phocaeicola sp.]